jgi:hypothetical protein
MLTISHEQFRKMAEACLLEFIGQNVIALQKAFPVETGGLAEGALQSEVSGNVEQLRLIGFERTGDIGRALRLLFQLKHGAPRRTVPEHIAAQFRDPGEPIETRLEALEQVFLFAPAAST